MKGNFGTARNGLLYGFVKGTSMWPAFIAGDVLRAEPILAADASPGDVIVIQQDNDSPIVHRLLTIESRENGFRLQTAGDRSGNDPSLNVPPDLELLRITGVLRMGSWNAVPDRFPLAGLVPSLMLRLHCRIVRILQWKPGKG